jgi:alkylation response protein AidB-like acyl-CoA dehydrogenase
VAIGGSVGERGSGPIGEALRVWEERWKGDTSAYAGALRERLVASWIRNEVARLTNLRALANRQAGTPGPEGSVAKLAFAEENKRTSELTTDLLGAGGMLYPPGFERVRPEDIGLRSSIDPRKSFLRARANSIEGGTSEVMRNILGERVLGLPGEPRADREVAWKDVPRS